jgi:type IV pilus modification protein PilV
VSTSRGRGVVQQGFTLIEVLIALVILSIGILGLEALGIYAIRAVAQADRNSRSAAVATLYLEDGLQRLRSSRRPQPCTDKLLPSGDRVTRMVTISSSPAAASVVQVTVVPASRGKVEQPYTVRGYAYMRVPIPPTAPQHDCP